jgi:hypothetical protein
VLSLTASFWVSSPAVAAGLAGQWVLFAVGYAWAPVWAFLRRPQWTMVALLRLSAPLHLVVGAVWVVLSHLDVRLEGLPWIIAPLTAIHFHFAGFAAAHLSARALRDLSLVESRSAALGAGLLLLGVPALAIGFMVSAGLKLGAALCIATGLCLIAIGALRRLARQQHLLRVSWTAVPLSMGLAMVYALGEYTGTWWLKIVDMAWTHGLLNGVVFAGCGFLGWWRTDR